MQKSSITTNSTLGQCQIIRTKIPPLDLFEQLRQRGASRQPFCARIFGDTSLQAAGTLGSQIKEKLSLFIFKEKARIN